MNIPESEAMNGEVRTKLKALIGTYDPGDYRKSKNELRLAIRARKMSFGLKTITDHNRKISSAVMISTSLPELNAFYAHFESNQDSCPPVLTRMDVCCLQKD